MTKGGKEALILCHLRFLHLEYHHLVPFFCSYFFPSILDVATRFALPGTITLFLLSSFLPPLYANITSCFDPFQHHKFIRSVMTPIRCYILNMYAHKEVITAGNHCSSFIRIVFAVDCFLDNDQSMFWKCDFLPGHRVFQIKFFLLFRSHSN